ncbi:MAG: DegV family protein [Oscillospiraceae bacterium]|nr:DegV family protein [Oscillospiraceae bacterium]
MTKIKFMTDTASDLPLKLTEELGIDMRSILLTIQGESYQEQRDLSKEEFYDILAHADEMPSTSQITSFVFQEAFEKYARDGYTDLIYISINAKGSATYQNACNARDLLYQEHPEYQNRMKIHILDGGNYTIAYGYPVLEAIKMADRGESVEDILNYLENWLSNVGVYFVPMTLKYVKKSGRLTAAAAFAGEILGLRPMIHIAHGEIAVSEKIRGEKNIISRITEKVRNQIIPGSPYLIIEGSNPAHADKLESALTKEFGYPPAYRTKVGSAVAINAGHDLVAVIFLEQQNT